MFPWQKLRYIQHPRKLPRRRSLPLHREASSRLRLFNQQKTVIREAGVAGWARVHSLRLYRERTVPRSVHFRSMHFAFGRLCLVFGSVGGLWLFWQWAVVFLLFVACWIFWIVSSVWRVEKVRFLCIFLFINWCNFCVIYHHGII